MIWSAKADHITSKFLKAVFHKFYLSILEYFPSNGNKNMSDHQKVNQVIRNNVNINDENMAQEYHNEEKNMYLNNEQGRMNSMLQ